MIKQVKGTYEYSQSLKIINKMTPVMLSEIRYIVEEIKQMTKEPTLVIDLKNTLSDMTNILKQIIILLKDFNNDKPLFIDMVNSMSELICEMMNDLVKVQETLEYLPLANDLKLHVKYQLEYLTNSLKQIIM